MDLITIRRPADPGPARTSARAAVRALQAVPARARHGRPVTLAVRTFTALTLGDAALHSGAGPGPITGLLAGITIWYLRTVPADLAQPRDGTP